MRELHDEPRSGASGQRRSARIDRPSDELLFSGTHLIEANVILMLVLIGLVAATGFHGNYIVLCVALVGLVAAAAGLGSAVVRSLRDTPDEASPETPGDSQHHPA